MFSSDIVVFFINWGITKQIITDIINDYWKLFPLSWKIFPGLPAWEIFPNFWKTISNNSMPVTIYILFPKFSNFPLSFGLGEYFSTMRKKFPKISTTQVRICALLLVLVLVLIGEELMRKTLTRHGGRDKSTAGRPGQEHHHRRMESFHRSHSDNSPSTQTFTHRLTDLTQTTHLQHRHTLTDSQISLRQLTFNTDIHSQTHRSHSVNSPST